ncbi:MAG: SMC-Scp complex subunit ScpB, partial [Gemmatimonadetes bacterium]|nr:SMC-Scp complex subunit ScpB [Gemmatimonadota bacterium]
ETLAIVAYKQPVLRATVESIRGVAVGDMLVRLREMNLIRIVGRAEEIGRPLLYGTTSKFLKVFGLSSLKDLPQLDETSPQTVPLLRPAANDMDETTGELPEPDSDDDMDKDTGDEPGGELQTGAWINLGQAASALSRSVQHPLCSGAHGLLNANPVPAGLSKGDAGYDDALNSIGLTAWERQVCIPANHDNDLHKYKQDFWKLRDLTARIPVGFAFQQLNSAVLTFTLQNYFRNMFDLPMFDPEMVGRDSVSEQNRSISEHVPPPAIFTASLRVTF